MINISNIDTIRAEYGHKSMTVARDYGDGDNFFDNFVNREESFCVVDYKAIDSLVDRFGGVCYLSFFVGGECRAVAFFKDYSLQGIDIL